METKQIIGQITNKKIYSGSSNKGPKGDFYIDRDKFSCWKEEEFNKFQIGDEVIIDYIEKENVTPDKTYTNKSITKIEYNMPLKDTETRIIESEKIQDTPHEGYPESELKVGTVTIKESTYEVILRLVS